MGWTAGNRAIRDHVLTPWVTYCYDGYTTTPAGCSSAPTGSLLVNRLTEVYSGASTSLLTAYDAVGNVLRYQQVTGGQTYTFTYAPYNKLGEITSLTYPSGRIVATTYDAAGRPASVQNGTTLTYYANPVAYATNGSTNSVTLGNTLLETTTFNTRFQPITVQAGSLLTLNYSYGTSNNNGNIQTQSMFDGTTTRTQSFLYDGVNRLTCANEVVSSTALTCGTGSPGWAQTYVFDPYGNRGLLSPAPRLWKRNPKVRTPASADWHL
jgi:YD repeat-containing protein